MITQRKNTGRIGSVFAFTISGLFVFGSLIMAQARETKVWLHFDDIRASGHVKSTDGHDLETYGCTAYFDSSAFCEAEDKDQVLFRYYDKCLAQNDMIKEFFASANLTTQYHTNKDRCGAEVRAAEVNCDHYCKGRGFMWGDCKTADANTPCYGVTDTKAAKCSCFNVE